LLLPKTLKPVSFFFIVLQLSSSEEVLSFMLRSVTELDGVVRTMVIAGEASQTLAIVEPTGLFSESAVDVVDRTDRSADAAFHTTV